MHKRSGARTCDDPATAPAAALSHALLYRRYQLALHGIARAALLWAAERINTLVQPKIRTISTPP